MDSGPWSPGDAEGGGPTGVFALAWGGLAQNAVWLLPVLVGCYVLGELGDIWLSPVFASFVPEDNPMYVARYGLGSFAWAAISGFTVQALAFSCLAAAVLAQRDGEAGLQVAARALRALPAVAVVYGTVSALKMVGYQILLPGLVVHVALLYAPAAVADRVDGTLIVRSLKPLVARPLATIGIVFGLSPLVLGLWGVVGYAIIGPDFIMAIEPPPITARVALLAASFASWAVTALTVAIYADWTLSGQSSG